MRASGPDAGSGRRRAWALLLALPVATSLLMVAARDLQPGVLHESSCWILPNLRALAPPGHPGCDVGVGDALRRLADGERVLSVSSSAQLRELLSRSDRPLTALVEREGRAVPVALPVHATTRSARISRLAATAVAACLLLAIPFSLLMRSPAPAALPLAFFYSAFAVIAVCLLSGRASPPAAIAALLCMAIAPGALVHLAFSFPRESRLRREVPAVIALPYALSAFLLVLGSLALWRTPELWPAFLTLLLAVCAGAWTVLIFSCAFGLRESGSALERARARVVLVGSLLLPIVPVALLALRGGVETRELPALYLWSSVSTMPLPVALAISRYNLFDLGFDARQGVARILYLAASAAALAAGAWVACILLDARDALPDAGGLLVAAFGCALAVEPLRARLPGALESWILPRLPALRSARLALERRLPALADEREILGCAEQALVAGIGTCAGAIFATSEGSPRLAHAFGANAAADPLLAASAGAALGRERLVHVAAARDAVPALDALEAAGVALVAALESEGERMGLLLLGSPQSGAFYRGVETEFVAVLASRVGDALRRARDHALRLARDREAAAGRLALALAHDTGKDIHWLRLLSRRLATHPQASGRARRDARMIAELSEELALTFRRVLDEAGGSGSERSGSRLDDLVERAVRRMGQRHGVDRIVDVVDPSARALRCPEPSARALEDALDDALRTSAPGAPVHLFASAEGGWIRVRIEHRGTGGAIGRIELPLCSRDPSNGAAR